MNSRQFFRKVAQLRHFQVEWFYKRDKKALVVAKRLEKEIDDEIERLKVSPDNRQQGAWDFANLVKDMRSAQRNWFAGHSRMAYDSSKYYEAQVDQQVRIGNEMMAREKPTQLDLFNQ